MKCKFSRISSGYQPKHYELELECGEEFVDDFEEMYHKDLLVKASNLSYAVVGRERAGKLTLKILVQEKQ